MPLPRILLAMSCAVALLLGACGKGGGSGGDAQFRVFNAYSAAQALNVAVGGNVVATGLGFQGLTTYASVPSSSQTVLVNVVGSASPLVNTTISMGGGASYSYLLYGTSSALVTGRSTFTSRRRAPT